MQLLTKVMIALHEVTQTVEQLLRQSEHLLLVFRLLVLYPGDMNHVEDTQEVLFTRHEDLLLKSLTPERGIVGEGQLQGRLKGHEHDDEVNRLTTVLDIFRVVLASQFVDVAAHTLDVLLQITLLILRRLGIHIFLIRHERHLRVYDGILTLRIVQDNVGLHLLARLVVLQRTAQLVAESRLHLIMDTLREPLRRQQVTEDNLTHVTAHLVVASEHVRQTLGLLAQLLRLLHHQLDLLSEGCRVGGRVLLVLRDGLLHVRDSLLQRLGDARHRLRVRLLQLRRTLFQHLLRHIHELGITFLLLLEFLTLRRFHLLVQQFQLTALRLRLGMQRLVLLLQMVHPTRDSVQLFVAHR